MKPEKDGQEEPLAMSREDVKARFPYGLPASLRSSWQVQNSNVVNLAQWRRRRLDEQADHQG
jgi:hypothetical protein